MKQHITPEQLNELSEKGKERLRKLREPRNGDKMANYKNSKVGMIGVSYWLSPKRLKTHKCFLPLLSIGQMIEFLDEHTDTDKYKTGKPWLDLINIKFNMFSEHYNKDDELVDYLWESVKDILEA